MLVESKELVIITYSTEKSSWNIDLPQIDPERPKSKNTHGVA